MSTIAGTGGYSYSGDGGAATSAQVNGPRLITVDTSGEHYTYTFKINKSLLECCYST